MSAVIPNTGQRWRCQNSNGSDWIIEITKITRNGVGAFVIQSTYSYWELGIYKEDLWEIDPNHLYSPQKRSNSDANYTYTYLKGQDKKKEK